MDLKKKFLEECGVDLTDYEYAGKFPSRNKHGVWGNIPRGEGWKRYAEWLESKQKLNIHSVSGALPLLDNILKEEMSAEMRTWLMELRLLIGNDR